MQLELGACFDRVVIFVIQVGEAFAGHEVAAFIGDALVATFSIERVPRAYYRVESDSAGSGGGGGGDFDFDSDELF